MVSTDNGEQSPEAEENFQSNGLNGNKSKDQIPLHVSSSQKRLPYDNDIKITLPNRLSLPKFSSERDEFSPSVPSTGQFLRERVNGVFSRKIDWPSLKKSSKEWIKNPLNMALFLWIICVAISGAILFLVMTGMLNGVLRSRSQRNTWFEVNNQILNALFTLICLYQHPKRFHHLVLLCKWNQKSISYLRNMYCKNGTYKPHERLHMTVVVFLLHVNCFAQYALCGLNLGYRRSERPAYGVGISLVIAIAAPVIASLYSILSPLGREYDIEMDGEAPDQTLSLGYNQMMVENKPEWRGDFFDLWEDITLGYLSLFCFFCVFGWNMERLGFGNMYVHIATFILFCMAPFWIFNLAAINIDNELVREALGITGIILCVFGLLYGGFWRIQMRKKFNLPVNNKCCGQPALADCAQWLFCCCCSLAQEVRTADYYDIFDDKFCQKNTDEHVGQLSPLPPEDRLAKYKSDPGSSFGNTPKLSKFEIGDSRDHSNTDIEFLDVQVAIPDMGNMKAPVPYVIQR